MQWSADQGLPPLSTAVHRARGTITSVRAPSFAAFVGHPRENNAFHTRKGGVDLSSQAFVRLTRLAMRRLIKLHLQLARFIFILPLFLENPGTGKNSGA